MGLTARATSSGAPATGPARYRLRADAGVPLQTFGDEVVAFNPATWNTHLLDRAAALVLVALESGPLGRDAIESLLMRESGAAPDEVAGFAEVLLGELIAAQLIQACDVAQAG